MGKKLQIITGYFMMSNYCILCVWNNSTPMQLGPCMHFVFQASTIYCYKLFRNLHKFFPNHWFAKHFLGSVSEHLPVVVRGTKSSCPKLGCSSDCPLFLGNQPALSQSKFQQNCNCKR